MADESPVDFGTFLRQAREKRGLSLQQVAATTKISARVLGALERNDVSKLPGGIFSRAFVRSYAREVGLDPEVAVAQFAESFPGAAGVEDTPAVASADDAEEFESGRRVATTLAQLLGISAVVIAVALIYVYGVKGQLKTASSPPPEPPKAVQSPAPQQPAVVRPPAGPSPSGTGGLADTPPATTAAAPPEAATAAAAAIIPSGSAATAAQTAPLAVVIAASGACWLSVSVDGKPVLSRVLQAGERVEYRANSGVSLTAGNAGALALTINGRAAKPIGTMGQVVTTTVSLDTLRKFFE